MSMFPTTVTHAYGGPIYICVHSETEMLPRIKISKHRKDTAIENDLHITVTVCMSFYTLEMIT